LNFENDKFNDLFRSGAGFANLHGSIGGISGLAEGPNEITGAYEHEQGVKGSGQEGAGRVTYASVREKHLDQAVYGAGLFSSEIGGARQEEIPVTDFVSTMNPAKAQGSLQFGGSEELHGGNWWDDFSSGFKTVVSPLTGIISSVAGLIPTPQGQAVSKATSWLHSVMGSGRVKKLQDFNLKELRKLVRHYNLSSVIKKYSKMDHTELSDALEKHIRIYNNKIYHLPRNLEMPPGVKTDIEGGSQPVLEDLDFHIKHHDIRNLRKMAKAYKGDAKIKGYMKMSEDQLRDELKKRASVVSGSLFLKPKEIEQPVLIDYAKIEADKADKKRLSELRKAAKRSKTGSGQEVIPAIPATTEAVAKLEAGQKIKRIKKGGNMPNDKQMLKDGIRMELDGRALPVASQLPGNTGGAKGGLTTWRTLLMSVMKDNKLNMRDAIAKIKREGLYKK
jgi:hypothetical protein